MQVETFEIEELLEKPAVEVDAEAVKLIQELGLSGQETLVMPATAEKPAVRQPYPEMNAEQVAVYKALFETHEEVSKYKAGIMPVRVLQVVAHARALSFFTKIEVWCPKLYDPDPILVGMTGANDWDGARRYYLLARWGETLMQFPQLVEKARKKLKDLLITRSRQAITKAEADIAGADHLVTQKLRGEWVDF